MRITATLQDLDRAELQLLTDSLMIRAADLTDRDAIGDVAVAVKLETLRRRVLAAALDAGFVVSFGQVRRALPPRRDVRRGGRSLASVRTGA